MAKIYDDLSAADIDTINLAETWGAHDQNLPTKITSRVDLYSIIDKASPRLKDDGSLTGTPTINFTNRAHRKGTLTGNITPSFNDPSEATRVIWVIQQDATGGRTITWSGMTLLPGDAVPVINVMPNAITVLEFYFDGTSYHYATTGVVNVLDYGADRTGVSSSAAAIQAALDTGLNVYLPSGEYLVDTTLTLTAAGQAVYGDGAFVSRITSSVTGTAATIDTNTFDYVELRDFSVFGQATGSPYQDTVAIWLNDSTRSLIRNVHVRYSAIGFKFTNAWILMASCLWCRFSLKAFELDTVNASDIHAKLESCDQNFTFLTCNSVLLNFMVEGTVQTTASTIDDSAAVTFSQYYSEYASAPAVPDIILGGTTRCYGVRFDAVKSSRTSSTYPTFEFDDVDGVFIGHGLFAGGTTGHLFSTTSSSRNVLCKTLPNPDAQGECLPPPTHNSKTVHNYWPDPYLVHGIPSFSISSNVSVVEEATSPLPDGMARAIEMTITGAGTYAYAGLTFDLTREPFTQLRGHTIAIGAMTHVPDTAHFQSNQGRSAIYASVDGTGGGTTPTRNRDYIPGMYVMQWNDLAIPADATSLEVRLYANQSANDVSGEIVHFGGLAMWIGAERNTLKYLLGDLVPLNVTAGKYLDTKGAAELVDDGNLTGTPAVDFSVSNHKTGTLTGNITPTFTDPTAPQFVTWVLTQDGTGGRTVTWTSVPLATGGTEPNVNTIAGSTTVITMYWDGTNYRLPTGWV
jgi:hypothetical protein